MTRFFIPAVLMLSLCLTAFYPEKTGKTGKLPAVYSYALKNIKTSDGPVPVTLIDTDRTISGKKPVANGLLFTYKNRKAASVSITGNFSGWNTVSMKRNSSGIWYYFLPSETAAQEIMYKFCVDGVLIRDPENPLYKGDRTGSFISVASLPVPFYSSHVTFRRAENGAVEFRLYRPDARLISLVGDFNSWNPENDLMKRGSDGIWTLTKKFASGTYRYMYIVDGENSPDMYNPESAYNVNGDICSVIQIEK